MAFSKWRPFPDPRNCDTLTAPFGPGVYELCDARDNRLILVGIGKNCAKRMTSLLPSKRGGCGTRNNSAKRNYIARHLKHIEYRTRATKTRADARQIEKRMLAEFDYLYGT